MFFFKKKPINILLIVLAVAVLLTVVSNFTDGFPGKAVKTIMTPFESAFSKITSPVVNFFENIGETFQKFFVTFFRRRNFILRADFKFSCAAHDGVFYKSAADVYRQNFSHDKISSKKNLPQQ